MIRHLLVSAFALAAVAVSSSEAFAIAFDPAPGMLDLAVNEGGLGAVDIIRFKGKAKVNRDANLSISLVRDGEVMKTISTSDVNNIYMFEEFDKMEWATTANISFYIGTSASSNPAVTPGEYSITVPEGAFLYADGSKTEELTGTWIIEPNALSFDPEDYSALTSIDKIKVTVDGTNVKFTDNTEVINTTDDMGNPVTYTKHAVVLESRSTTDIYIPEASVEGNVVTFTFDPPVEKIGKYYFSLLPGCISYTNKDGKARVNNEAIMSYSILDMNQTMEIEPVEGTYQQFNAFPVLDGRYAYFTLEFSEKVSYALAKAPRMESVDGSFSKLFTARINKSNPKQIYLLNQMPSQQTIDEPLQLEEGEYILTVPAETVQFANATKNMEKSFRFTIKKNGQSAVEIIESNDNERFDIYSVTGVRVAKDADSEAVRNLAPGLYIANGRKFIVK